MNVYEMTFKICLTKSNFKEIGFQIFLKNIQIWRCFNTKATFTLHRFHFDPFLLPKTELFSSLFTLLRFQTETNIDQLVPTIFLKNASVFLFMTMRPSRLLILAFLNCSVFGVHTTELRFCLALFSFSSVFITVFI